MILPHESAATPALDLDLIRKYSAAAPRYTSYPPATKFTADLATLPLDEAIAADNAPGAGPLSLYFHLPFCESLCWYCGCNTIITTQRGAAAEYLDDLKREMELVAARLDGNRLVQQVHFGGGTPTFLQPAELARLGLRIRELFHLAPHCEFGVEIDPRRLTQEQVEALRAKGVTDVVVFGGGIIPDDDFARLREAGVKGLFTPGTPLGQIIDWVKTNVTPRAA